MTIGIDIRSLMTPLRTGVAAYAKEFVDALVQVAPEHTYVLFYNSFADVTSLIPSWNTPAVRLVRTAWPNKCMNLSLSVLGRPHLDAMLGLPKVAYFFSPNLNFTALSKDTKHILTIHDLSFELFPECYTWKQRAWHRILQPKKQCREAYKILTPSQNTKWDIMRVYDIPEENITVISPAISPTFLLSEKKSSRPLPEKYLLCFGTMEPRKNILSVLEAYAEGNIYARFGYSLVIAGAQGWNNAEIQRQIARTPGVVSIGPVREEEKYDLYRNARLFLYPSLYEGFGFPVLEAFAAGVPVITSHRSSLPEVVRDSAYLVHPSRHDELVTAMERLLSDNRLCEILSTRGKKRVEAFSWTRAAEQFLSLL
ncbi:MAG TPA: glycosyltransferase family 1 protein [Candidatus Kapabacteria bacterium]|nr:glycosyltransferase family 1 protein [Candidatus Kapabacteria bacterium]